VTDVTLGNGPYDAAHDVAPLSSVLDCLARVQQHCRGYCDTRAGIRKKDEHIRGSSMRACLAQLVERADCNHGRDHRKCHAARRSDP